MECANKTPGGLTDAGGRRAGTGVQEHAPGNACGPTRGHSLRVCAHPREQKAATCSQQLRTGSRSPDGLRMRRGSPKHLRKQPRRASGVQHRGSRGVCSRRSRACEHPFYLTLIYSVFLSLWRGVKGVDIDVTQRRTLSQRSPKNSNHHLTGAGRYVRRVHHDRDTVAACIGGRVCRKHSDDCS